MGFITYELKRVGGFFWKHKKYLLFYFIMVFFFAFIHGRLGINIETSFISSVSWAFAILILFDMLKNDYKEYKKK